MLKKLASKLLKHKKVNVKELVGITDRTPVIVFNTKPDAVVCKYGKYGGNFEIEDRVVITNVTHNNLGDNKAYSIVWLSAKDKYMQTKVNYFPVDTEFGVLTGSTRASMLNAITKAALKDIRNHLPKIVGYVGSDPEIFVTKKDGTLIPAFEFLKSNKDKDCTKTADGSIVYWDGFQAEFTTKPYGCLAYHTDSVQYGLKALLDEAKKYDKGAKLSIQTVMQIPEQLLKEGKKEFVELGCMPSENAYKMKGEDMGNGRTLPIRSAGGHIHFSLNKNQQEKAVDIVKGMDAIIGVACVALFANYDNPMRRKYYGMAGEYRLPAHGIEYRTLSNAWLVHPFAMNIVFDLARVGAAFGYHGFVKHFNATEKEIIDCINACDVKKAQEIMDRNKDIFLNLLQCVYPFKKEHIDMLYEVFYNGIDKYLKNPEDVEANWLLDSNSWLGHGESPDKNCAKGILVVQDKRKLA
jgi:hypothetical protein